MYGLLIYDQKGIERNGWFINQLLSHAEKIGEELRLTSSEKLYPGVRGGAPFVAFPDGRKPDYAIVRTIFPLLSETLESMGVRVFNSALVSRTANDKRATAALCARLGIPTPDTVFLNRYTFDPDAFSYPLILKSADGHGGKEVFYVENPKSASEAVESLKTGDFLLQKVVDKGRDVRVYLLNGEILAAVERSSAIDFRSNFSLGGSYALYEASDEMKDAVKKICKALQPIYLGVDFIFDNGRPLLNEIEDAAGARMLYRLTDLPVHRLYLEAVLRAAKNNE